MRAFDDGDKAGGGCGKDEGKPVAGKTLKSEVTKVTCTPARSRDGWSIIIRGIGPDAQDEDITEAFSPFGEIVSLQMPLNRMTGFVKGYCMLEYRVRTEAEAAISAMSGQTLRDWTLDVSWLCQQPSACGTGVGRARSRSR
mmetsp:Transcript_81936/g.228365  ORF Transcript_81936/g.228365 Transcript_81936/m.228365 type:complete len:141 (+) Transcript_81936:67-489(+)